MSDAAIASSPLAGDPTRFYDTGGHHHPQNGTLLGFWIYLMSDLLIFACLFAVYGVLGRSFAAGPTGADLFGGASLAGLLRLACPARARRAGPGVLTLVGVYAAIVMWSAGVLGWLAVTGLFGAAFLGLELYEFSHLVHEGAGPQRSAFLSSFFALVGTHGLHVAFGIVWLVVLMVEVRMHGLHEAKRRRLMCLSLFWHFLDVVWIGVFTFVYLMGVLP